MTPTQLVRLGMADTKTRHHIDQAFATLDRHASRGPLDERRAHAMLYRNARDCARLAPARITTDDRNRIATLLLTAWKQRAIA